MVSLYGAMTVSMERCERATTRPIRFGDRLTQIAITMPFFPMEEKTPGASESKMRHRCVGAEWWPLNVACWLADKTIFRGVPATHPMLGI